MEKLSKGREKGMEGQGGRKTRFMWCKGSQHGGKKRNW